MNVRLYGCREVEIDDIAHILEIHTSGNTILFVFCPKMIILKTKIKINISPQNVWHLMKDLRQLTLLLYLCSSSSSLWLQAPEQQQWGQPNSARLWQ